jgi:UDP-GlcNAc:undecaprenyl-phosphate GlcNAc-1-phosphate transferase
MLVALISAVVTFALTWVTLKISHRYKLYPQIRARDVHTKPTPRLGGVAMFFGFVAALAAAGAFGWFKSVFADPVQILAIVGAAFLITLIGFLDDLLPIAGLTIGSFGTSLVATVFLTVLVMNAVNFIDGLDGLVSGVVLIGTVVFFGYSYLLAQKTSPSNYFNLASLISAIVIGMCIGFLPLNWRPAKIFMGDSGAMLLGLLMATSALTVTGQIDPHMAGKDDLLPAFIPLILPLAILVLPLLDFTMAVLRRLRAGKSPFAADRQHIHHRLQDLGHSHVGSVLVFYIWTALISISCFLFFFFNWQTILVFAIVSASVASIYTVWPIIKKRKGARIG